MYFFNTRLVPVESQRGVEERKLLQRPHARADNEGQRSEFETRILRLLLELASQVFELRDIRLVELRNMRDVDPARV